MKKTVPHCCMFFLHPASQATGISFGNDQANLFGFPHK